MKDGSILLWKYEKRSNFFDDLLGKAIVYFSEAPYTHSALYLDGKIYEMTVWTEGKKRYTGLRVRIGLSKSISSYREPRQPLNAYQRSRMYKYFSLMSTRPYNVFKLVALAIVYPTRWFWKKIGWVPFDHDFYGEVCSGFVDEAFKEAGLDLFRYEHEGYTTPGNLARLPSAYFGEEKIYEPVFEAVR